MGVIPSLLVLVLGTTLGLSDDHAKTKPVPPTVPPKTSEHEKDARETKSSAKEAVKKTTEHAEEKEKEKEEKEAPKPAPRPVVRKRPTVPAVQTTPSFSHASEAELRAARLVEENARLQQELARRQAYSVAPVQTPGEAKAELLAGNERFVQGHRVRTLLSQQDVELRDRLSRGQNPFAVIVTCSDSRLADNLLFDQEMGRLFTIREAGNCPDIQGLASIEYAVEHLGSKLVVVLGHTSCGAIKAVKEAHGVPMPGNLWSLQAAMAGLLETTHEDPNEHPSALLTRLSENNAIRQCQTILDRSGIVRHLVDGGKIQVVPALYDLGSGRVRFLEMPRSAPAPKSH